MYLALLILSILFLNNDRWNIPEAGAEGYPIKKGVYSLKADLFETRDFFLSEQNITLSFAEYRKEVSLEHPPRAETLPSQAMKEEVVQECLATIKGLAEDIVKLQSENPAIEDYLTAGGGTQLFTAEDYIHLVETPEEQTVQIDPAANRLFAEFRSSLIPLSQNKSYCLYTTFVYIPERNQMERILISTAVLRPQEESAE